MFKNVGAFNLKKNHQAIVIGAFERAPFIEVIEEMNALLGNQLHTLKKAISKRGECTTFYTIGNLGPERVIVLGLGKKEDVTLRHIREGFACVGKEAVKHDLTDLGFLMDTFVTEAFRSEDLAVLLGESLALSTYRVRDYKEKSNKVERELEAFSLYGGADGESLSAAASIGYVYGSGANRARKLVNLPANLLTPTDLAEEAKELATTYAFEIEILDEAEMEKLGMGALLAVSRGSDQPAKMITLKYEGNPGSKDVLGLVGKGLTFDSGGISIKPSENMHKMKMDMGGAAAVLGAMEIVGEVKPRVNVLAVIPSTENLLNGSALKPGDVIRSLQGKTIEVRNTDAEGRLILADGVTYAKQLGATSLIDVATLTGAVVVALGDCTTGAVTNNQALLDDVLDASGETGEWIWPFPSYEPYREMLKSSDVADLNNAPGRSAGSITAGLFIGEFAEETPWVHLDIAGTAWQSKATSLGPIGGTGVMARTLARLAVNKQQ